MIVHSNSLTETSCCLPHDTSVYQHHPRYAMPLCQCSPTQLFLQHNVENRILAVTPPHTAKVAQVPLHRLFSTLTVYIATIYVEPLFRILGCNYNFLLSTSVTTTGKSILSNVQVSTFPELETAQS